MVSTVSSSVRSRFPDRVLARLLDAGWHDGRCWDSDQMHHFLNRFNTAVPSAAVKVLSEFGGLTIGFRGRIILFGDIDERLCGSIATLSTLLHEPLFPVGTTNIFEDDGLGVHIDESGMLYVDGASGYDPPRDHRLDLIESDIDGFLIQLFSEEPTPEKQSWYYSQSDFE